MDLQNPDTYVRGRLFLTDTIFQNSIELPLPNQLIKLATSDTLNFLYSSQTDSAGYFVFQKLQRNDVVALRYSNTINGVAYFADTLVQMQILDLGSKNAQNLKVTATVDQIHQNGFYIYSKDSLGGIIPGAVISIYSSAVLANLNDPAGAYKTVSSDNRGVAYCLNLPHGTYYLNASITVAGKKFQRIKKMIIVPKKGITPYDSIMLK
jgi:hypothetical protein